MQTMKQSPDMKQQFAQTLRQAMENAGYAAKPAVLQREFNSRHPAEKPITLHGVRRWLMGETIPSYPKLQVLSDWLGVPVHDLMHGTTVPSGRPTKTPNPSRPMGYEDRQVVEAFLKLPAAPRRIARDVILAIARADEVGRSS
ncbi:XRE family transcriptional regulator [Acidovorax sp. NCPPB 3576]|uniref:XRE family transcriptional regulator n=2 Tax=unclassified Acidovorax TaxID=2684926 RepID=UPI00234A3CA7|nr:XRE family transcriptional regulator [Acidovorax sp. NCPPB 3576]WCM90516.1 XRE family transcriptional regulator [Acidovorax sp. NCPPB 3576]